MTVSPSLSSQTSPTPLLLKSAWPGLATAGQLSLASGIPSPSVSTNGQPLLPTSPATSGQASSASSTVSPSLSSQASPTPLLLKSAWPGFATDGQLSLASSTPSPSLSTGVVVGVSVGGAVVGVVSRSAHRYWWALLSPLLSVRGNHYWPHPQIQRDTSR